MTKLKITVSALLMTGAISLTPTVAMAKDMILTAIKPNKIVLADPEAMKIDKVIEVKDGGPTLSTLVATKDGKHAFVSANRMENIVKLNLDTGEEVFRIQLSNEDTRVKAMLGMDLSPDGSTIAVYENPSKLLRNEYKVLPTRVSLYDAMTGKLKAREDAPRQITIMAYSKDGSKLYGLGRALHIFDGKTGKKIGEHKTQAWEKENFYPPDVLDVWQQWESAGVLSTPYYTVRSDKSLDDPTAYWTGVLRLDLATGEFTMNEVENTDVFYFSSAIDPNNKHIAYAAYNNLTKLDAKNGKAIKRVDLPHSYYAVNLTSDGKKVIIGGAMGDIRIFDTELNELGAIDMPGGANMGLANMRMIQR